jgi:glycerophosphoryl diester phosphodiesterase
MDNLLHDVSWVIPLRSPFLTAIFEGFTWLGYATFLMMLLPLGYWLWNKNAFTRITVLVVLSTLLNGFLKDYWQNPRPDALFRLDPGVGESFGMPSGHAQIAATLWFGLALEARKKWVWILSTFLVVGICCSRIYLGVHDLEDVLMGLFLAFLSLGLYHWVFLRNGDTSLRVPLLAQLLALVFLQVILHAIWPDSKNSIEVLALIGFLFGWLLGAQIERTSINFVLLNNSWSRPVAAAIGLIGMVALLSLFKPLLGMLEPIYAAYIQTTLIGLYMAALAPWLFKLLGVSR